MDDLEFPGLGIPGYDSNEPDGSDYDLFGYRYLDLDNSGDTAAIGFWAGDDANPEVIEPLFDAINEVIDTLTDHIIPQSEHEDEKRTIGPYDSSESALGAGAGIVSGVDWEMWQDEDTGDWWIDIDET